MREIAFSREAKLAYTLIDVVYVIHHIKYKLLYYQYIVVYQVQ